jgi:hypothetical protein
MCSFAVNEAWNEAAPCVSTATTATTVSSVWI